MDQYAKTYAGLVFVILALFEFWSAMGLFGAKDKPGPHAKLVLRLHRIAGYFFLLYAIWLCWVGFAMLERYSGAGGYDFGPREVAHATLALILVAALLLKISFIRTYRKYRPYVPLLGILVAATTVVVWLIAGAMFLAEMGSAAG